MHQEIEWIERIVPDVIDTLSQRYAVLKQIAAFGPIGRRSLAEALGMSERILRSEADCLKRQELVAATKSGMVLTDKGKEVIQGLASFIDQLLDLKQLELRLSQKLGIENCLVVAGDSDDQLQVVDEMGKLVTNTLKTLLPHGRNIIAAMGGTTMAQIAACLTPDIGLQRELLFVPARGGLGERMEIQANNVCARMARRTGGKSRSLYVPEQVSESTYRPLLKEPAVQEVVNLIGQSNAVIHSIGTAMHMAHRRSMAPEVIAMLNKKKAVGEAFGYFFDEKGQIVYRISRIGIQLEDLASMECVIAVAGGTSKAKAIVSYMKHAPKQTCLITDEGAAKAILKE
ncbi:sugar-binding transcriptional regulator [Ligilactobacillus murinus]|uniref:SorC family transcriptional regulator n=1 Tax=Ligilactobacillus murinus TaxID=1622 RepID=A0AAD0KYW6_9LACO|nr:sugar-binding domain-containing protein [Ligilactobacillus murinus]AWZ37754.1 SorC family transcriptional regulator [Ligilactobacillus murinus]HBV47964.1 SorC family transcriptional regulator [Lactobacillus sp.]